ncbi:MAG: serine--tRNA ligase [Myxococcota bacterium]|nr:serine--tRNA ligase [Myxococcota bacterium]
MLDLKMLRNNPEPIRHALLKRMDTVDFGPIFELDERRRDLISQVDSHRAQRKAHAKQIGRLRAQGGDFEVLEQQAMALKTELSTLEKQLQDADDALHRALIELPNYPDERIPAGGKENNIVVRTWGEKPSLGADAADHVSITKRLGLVDFERGTKLGGNGFWMYTGQGAALEWALLDFFCREHRQDGYQFCLPPHLLVYECGYTAGQFPKFADDVFHLNTTESERERFLLPTAETAVLNIYRDEILAAEDLPLKLFAYTPCYRREAGSYRAEERGTIRGHQFNKVEMFQFCTPEQAQAGLDEMVAKAQRLVEKLGLHYQTTLLAARDASASMAMTYDVEVWLPSMNAYKEVSSISWARDYQARRAKTRYRPAGEKRTEFVHTLNGSGLATSRLVPAIIEQNQQPDGSVRVPEPLRPWLGTDVLAPLSK